jgi:hypothetical protein
MADQDSLYRELKPDIERLAGSLFEATRVFIKNGGAFLPHGAVLDAAGEIQLVMATGGSGTDVVSSSDVLPALHAGLRQSARQEGMIALAVCEDVRIRREGEKETRAIKVLVEHKRDLSVAPYMPFRRRWLGYSYGDVFVKPAAPEVNAWHRDPAH